MSQETVFQYGDYKYSIIDFNRRTCRIGDNSESKPNAIADGYSKDVIIPSRVWYENKLFYVTEIGQYAFYGINCPNIKKVFIPYTVEVIREWGLARLFSCEVLQFESGSHLKTIETHALYDLYKIKSISFPSNCLEELGYSSMRFMKDELKELIIPSSVVKIENCSFGGMTKLEHLYYCGLHPIKEMGIFESLKDNYVTPNLLQIHVLSNYEYKQFGERTITKNDADDHCKELNTYCSLYKPISVKNTFSFNLDIILFTIFCSRKTQ